MRKIKIMFAVLVCLMVSTGVAGPRAATLNFRVNGFSIDALEGVAGQAPYQVLAMLLPVSDGFAPNVNLQIQPYPGTMDDYMALSKAQLVQAGLKLIREARVDKAATVIEYSGTMQGRKLRFYARMVLREKKVYLITATAAEEQWASVAAKLKACVDSFRLQKPSALAAG